MDGLPKLTGGFREPLWGSAMADFTIYNLNPAVEDLRRVRAAAHARSAEAEAAAILALAVAETRPPTVVHAIEAPAGGARAHHAEIHLRRMGCRVGGLRSSARSRRGSRAGARKPVADLASLIETSLWIDFPGGASLLVTENLFVTGSGRKLPPDPSGNALPALRFEVALPDSNYGPSHPPKGSGDEAITNFVLAEFGSPPLRARLGQ